MANWVGQAWDRIEDLRLLTGRGRFVADLTAPGLVSVAFVRSPHAHAAINRVDLEPARRTPGVVAAFSGADLAPHIALGVTEQPPLALQAVHYVGEPVAVVVAEDRYAAEDGVEAVAVDWTPLPVVTDVRVALAEGAPTVVAGRPNLIAERRIGYGDVAAQFARAAVVVQERLVIHRATAQPLETRGVMAIPDPDGSGVTVWTTTQSPHELRRSLARSLRLSEDKVRVRTPDVGGSFGVKNRLYPEEVVVAWLAMRLVRPVRWIEDRLEHFAATQHEREQVHEVELAADAEGRLLALRDRFVVDNGAYVRGGVTVMQRTAMTIPGPYRLPALEAVGRLVRTHKTPIGPYRGAGRPQGCFVMERMMDRLAEAVGQDRAEVRRRNLIPPDAFPYATGIESPERVVYDSGDFPAVLEEALALAGWDQAAARIEAARQEGRWIGIGLAMNVEDTGGGGYEGARVRVDGNGEVTVYSGAVAQGQGHETAFAQVAAEVLDLPPERIRVALGDTDDIPLGIGTFGSRATTLAGNAVRESAIAVRRQIVEWAARLLEADPEDVVWEGGAAYVRGVPERRISLEAIAARANPLTPIPMGPEGPLPLGLEATTYFQSAPTYSSGCHACWVEVDPRTGQVRVLDYVVVHDCGRMLNPKLVEGQIYGGVLFGLSTVLLEELRYGEDGQLLTTTFLDYPLPTTTEMPPLRIAHRETPSPRNPLGIKGAGESGTIPALAALTAAVEDALKPFGVHLTELPLTPERLLQALAQSQSRP
ncbi:MAG: xanthine dehydrogenase family protein molybdopterin-binding subunit [Firmicutes bacterium]|nr:xanthine dehydrogenase family protein molybdopterin-binding subunit [Alicyclobacillaceae bacterium]MCL6497145.1 xanthine dehydrogenase family protein molybdopterin-binding subunit [Bacillota bacterium]